MSRLSTFTGEYQIPVKVIDFTRSKAASPTECCMMWGLELEKLKSIISFAYNEGIRENFEIFRFCPYCGERKVL